MSLIERFREILKGAGDDLYITQHRRHLRDAHLAALMINNDRIPANTANPLLVLREDSELLA